MGETSSAPGDTILVVAGRGAGPTGYEMTDDRHRRFVELLLRNETSIKAFISSLVRDYHTSQDVFQDVAMILLEMESAEAMRKTMDRYRECPRIINFFTTMGGYNLIALVMAEDQGTLESESMERCALRSGEGIRRSEFYPISEVSYQPFLPVRKHLTHKGSMVAPCNVNCVSCERYESRECVGCPTTVHYCGKL